MINKISRKRSHTEIKHMQVSDEEITTVDDIADILADSFSGISSTTCYTTQFQSHKARTERQPLKFNSNNMETYNIPFSVDALSNSNDSAVGLDDIHYQMLKHLFSEAFYSLLNTLSDMWISGNFPSSWLHS